MYGEVDFLFLKYIYYILCNIYVICTARGCGLPATQQECLQRVLRWTGPCVICFQATFRRNGVPSNRKTRQDGQALLSYVVVGLWLHWFCYVCIIHHTHSRRHPTPLCILHELEDKTISRSALKASILPWRSFLVHTSTASCYLLFAERSRGRFCLVVQDAIARRLGSLGEHGPPGRCGGMVGLSWLFRWMGLSSNVGSIERLVDTSSAPFGMPELIRHADRFEH